MPQERPKVTLNAHFSSCPFQLFSLFLVVRTRRRIWKVIKKYVKIWSIKPVPVQPPLSDSPSNLVFFNSLLLSPLGNHENQNVIFYVLFTLLVSCAALMRHRFSLYDGDQSTPDWLCGSPDKEFLPQWRESRACKKKVKCVELCYLAWAALNIETSNLIQYSRLG